MKVCDGALPGLKIIEPDVYGDARGWFMECWNRRRYAEAGIDVDFIQQNLSRSSRDVLRGLHYQQPDAQGKLVSVIDGEVFDVAVDIRVGSPTFGRWDAVILSGENKKQFYVPGGFAHGFCVLSETAVFGYLCTALYNAEADRGVAWDDPAIGIEWPVSAPRLSDKDLKLPVLAALDHSLLPKHGVPA